LGKRAFTLYTLFLTFSFVLALAFVLRPQPVSEPFTLPLSPYILSPGINVELAGLGDEELQKTLDLLSQGGFQWVRQRFAWEEIELERGRFAWEKWDKIVKALNERGFKILAVLDTSPKWARRPEDLSLSTAPPAEIHFFGDFAEAFARRYGSLIDAYQIWDEPNIYPHWGERWVDPEGYTALLKEGYIRIKSVDPQAFILMAGLAPTTEKGPINLNEVEFLRKMLSCGAKEFFDALSLKAFGFDYPPYDRPSPERLNFRRPELIAPLVKNKPVWIVEAGWNALPAGWQGGKSIWGSVTEEKQAQWTKEALQWAGENWGWPVFLTHFKPQATSDDPYWGFALIWQDWTPRPVYRAVAGFKPPSVLPPGAHRPDHPAIHYQGDWRISPYGADIPHGAQGNASIKFSFTGTGLDILVRRGNYKAFLFVIVDGKPSNSLPQDSAGRSYAVLYDPLCRASAITLARNLPFGKHHVEIVPDGGWSQWAIVGFRVKGEEKSPRLPIALLTGLYFLALSTPLTLKALDRFAASSLRFIPLSVFLVLAILWHLLPPIASLLSLPLWFLAFYLRPEAGLAITIFSAPFFLLHKNLLIKNFSPQELALALTTLAVLLRYRGNILKLRLTRLDLAVVALVAMGALSLLWAENFGVAAYEFRRVVAEAALLYGLIILVRREKPYTLYLLTDAFMAGAMLVSLVGISQFFQGQVIAVEGVRRIKAFYGSPNNLALFLGRAVPIALAIVLSGRSLRKWLYALAGAIILVALYLTFSRGAIFLGIPAAVLFTFFLKGKKALVPAAVALILLVLALIPWFWTARFSSLLDLEKGTGFFRVKLWEATLNMLKDNPILGVGLDNFLYQYRTRYVLPEAWQELNLSHPHNFLLDWWTRLGVGGVIILGWMLWEFFRAGLKRYRRMPEGEEKALLLGFMGAMVETLAHGLVDHSFFLPDLAPVFMLTLAWVRHGEEDKEVA